MNHERSILFVITPSAPFVEAKGSLDQKSSYYIPQPIGLCYLGAVLKQKGFEVDIFDPHIEHFKAYAESGSNEVLKLAIRARLQKLDYRILGISAPYIYTYQWAHYIAALSKEVAPGVPVVVGNGYPSLLPERALDDRAIDYAVIGEGEICFPKLAEALCSGGSDQPETIDGIAGRNCDGKLFVNPKTTFIKDVDSLPFPDWSLISCEKYFEYVKQRSLIVMSSRGCPYQCTFCNSSESWGRGFRKRSPENVLKEIDYLISTFKIDNLMFIDDNMTIDKKRFIGIANGIKERHITWSICNISSFTTDDEMLVAMKDSGCSGISISVESAVPRVLKELRKPVNLKNTEQIVESCRRIGLRCRLNYIVGLPYETKADVLETLEYSSRVKGDWNQYSLLIPYPGTEIYQYCLDRDYFIEKSIDLSKFNQRQVFIQNEHWNADWIRTIAYDYNIRTNFIENYNLVGGGRLDAAIEDFGYVARFIAEHAIANMCLAYAYDRKGDAGRSRAYVEKTAQLFLDPEVRKTYGKYLDWDSEVVRFYRREAGEAWSGVAPASPEHPRESGNG